MLSLNLLISKGYKIPWNKFPVWYESNLTKIQFQNVSISKILDHIQQQRGHYLSLKKKMKEGKHYDSGMNDNFLLH